MSSGGDTTQPQSGTGLGERARGDGSYRVLARKYRPATFDELIGQQAMVRTVSNAFATGRVPQAWILTGVRGVGKTTTARILARALNYELPDGSVTSPTVDMPGIGIHCPAIMESRHIDVIEMDAASHNGVDDVRQINEAVRYAPVSARYKVYILDEVHMLTPQAFNALLKTLEEPPPHAKFIFATTEVRKVPITILSRCQRFDLRRVDAAAVVNHLAAIARKENIEVDAEALSLIARAAEGSVRDSLSLLDQAVAHAAGPVRAEHVRQMLGLADRARVIELFDSLMRGDMAAALDELRAQYDAGADPMVVLTDLAEFTHCVTRMKAVPSAAEDPVFTEIERARGRSFAENLSMAVLSRTWQMLLKGIAEVGTAGRPLAAAEMVLVRIAYAAQLPTPDAVIRSLDEKNVQLDGDGASRTADLATGGPSQSSAEWHGKSRGVVQPPTAPRTLAEQQIAPDTGGEPLCITCFADLITLAADKRDLAVKLALERDVRLVRCEDGRLEVRLEPTAAKTLINDLTRKFSQWTNRAWVVQVSADEGEPTVKAQNEARKAELRTDVRADPLVQAVLQRFPGAEIVDVRKGELAVAPPSDSANSGSNSAANADEELGCPALPDHPALRGHEDA
jgi:DNA polymerase-3 subunit gamma/tau